MHFARSLVQPASQRALRTLESRATTTHPVARATLLDAAGNREHVALLHPVRLRDSVSAKSSTEDALGALQKFRDNVSHTRSSAAEKDARPACDLSATSLSPPVTLYIKGTAKSAREELARRQERLLAKWEGRLLASDFNRVGRFVDLMLRKANAGEPFTDADIGAYRGIVEELCGKDTEAALAVALNSRLPPLSAAASSALAKMVDLHTPTATTAFLEAFAARDSAVPGNETCATQLACRLQRELGGLPKKASGAEGAVPSQEGEEGEGNAARVVPAAAELSSELRRALATALKSGNVDPGSVFPADAAAIQSWARDTTAGDDTLPTRQAEEMRRLVVSRRLLPRRVVMDALSTRCLTDLEREWVRFAAFGDAPNSCPPIHPVVQDIYRHQSLALLLKDPKRYLVGNRLLREYAALLEQGQLSVTDMSFPAFLEECGECHDCGESDSGATESQDGGDRPEWIRFTMPPPPAGVPILSALNGLAPFSAYWTSLLALPDVAARITVSVAPMGELFVQVRLSRGHECVAAAVAMAEADSGSLPCVTTLFEDSDIIVVDKPAGLATSRHALSCSQAGTQVTDLVSVLSQPRKGTPSLGAHEAVFRRGQVHRLDRETSGCVVFAKTNAAVDSLRHQMGTSGAFSHSGKIYLALCVVLEPQLNLLPLRHELVDPRDSKVKTQYRVLQFFRRSRVVLVECRIQQGKKHQIRRHLASAGLPILGDLDHGGAACCTPLIGRVALHARHLSFVHPTSGEVMSVTAPLPADFQRALTHLSHS